jgi:hypothetical protein
MSSYVYTFGMCKITFMPLTFIIDLGITYQGLDNLFPL